MQQKPPHPDDIDGPVTVNADGIEWTTYVSPAIDPGSIFMVNQQWLDDQMRLPPVWSWQRDRYE